MKTCLFCRGPVEPARVDYMAHAGEKYFLLRDLSVERCRQCGEVYLDAAASRRIDAVLATEPEAQGHMDVPVFECG